MALLCLLTNTPWPWPTPAGAASARGGFPTLGTERERSGGGVAQRRSAQAQRGRLGCLLSRARDGVPQEGLVTLLCAERRRAFWVGVAGGKGPLRFSLACQSFSFLFRGVKRGYFSLREAQRDHEGRRATDLGQGSSPARSRIQVVSHGSLSAYPAGQ